MRHAIKVLASVLLFFVAVVASSCSTSNSASTPKGGVFIYIPNSIFKQGPPPTASGTATAPVVTKFSTTSQRLSIGSKVAWTVSWSTKVVTSSILFYVDTLGGYYEIPVDAAQGQAGVFAFTMGESDQEPGQSGCNGTFCWEPAPQGTTDATARITLVGPGDDVGQPSGGIGLTWEDAPLPPEPTPTPTPTPEPSNDKCPSAAQLGCCTTRGGIQVIGVGLDPSCPCPSGTCRRYTATFCGCAACGGC